MPLFNRGNFKANRQDKAALCLNSGRGYTSSLILFYHLFVSVFALIGTNLQAIIDAIKDGSIQHAKIVRVVSNRAAAKGLIRAKEADIPTLYHNLKKFGEQNPHYQKDPVSLRHNYDRSLAELVLQDQPDILVAAGFMHVLSPAFLDPLAGLGIPAINLHPALPGQFNGIDAIGRAHQAFIQGSITKTGLTVHYLIAEVDAGEPLIVKELTIQPGETLEQLEQRMHALEWVAIVEGVQLVIKNLAGENKSIAAPHEL
ncbi:MAG: hypothetical protein Q9168_000304 [Polycauliona sp. 1 TL-2023]